MESILHDIRYAFRQFRRAPLFALCAILILALGSVGSMAIWTLLEGLVLRTLPVHRPGELVAFSAIDPRNPEETGHLLAPALALIEEQQRVFRRIGGYATGSAIAEIDGRRADAGLAFVTPGYFEVLGVRPSLGRFLTDDEIAIAAPVAVVTHRWWQRHLGSAPDVLNHVVRLDGVPFTIVGVTERRFTGVEVGFSLDFSVPAGSVRAIYKLPAGFVPPVTRAIGRLRPDVTAAQAETQLRALWPGVRAATVPPGAQADALDQYLRLSLSVSAAARGFSYLRDWYRGPLLYLAAAMLCLLAVTSVNVATLALGRAHARSSEMAVRRAVGASNRRLARQVITESTVLSVCAAVISLPAGWWIARRIAVMLWRTSEMPPLDLTPDLRLMIVAGGSVVFAGVLLGSGPAWIVRGRWGSGSLQSRLNEQRSTSRWSYGLLVVQVGAAAVLLTAAVVIGQRLNELRTTNAGFEAGQVGLVSLVSQPAGYANVDVASYLTELARHAAATPGVKTAALSIPEPVMGLSAGQTRRRIASSSLPPGASEISATFVAVSPGFFDALRVSVLRGRDFEWRDRTDTTPVCILSSSLAQHVFGTADAVGQHVRIGAGPRRRAVQVVGIVADARLADLHDAEPRFVFVPILQEPPDTIRSPAVVLRLEETWSRVAPELMRRIEGLGQDFAVRPRTLSQQVDGSLLRERLLALGGRYFGAVATLLVAIGLYGLLSSTVARRTREIAVRAALGAPRASLYALVLEQTVWIIAAGLAVGLPAAWITTRAMQTVLGQAADGATLLEVAAVVSAVSLLAAWLPASRAVAVAPVDVLRHE